MKLNVDLIRVILESTSDYYLAAKENTYRHYGETKRGKDHIYLIAIPAGTIERSAETGYPTLENLTVAQANKILETEIETNLALSVDYAPFQKYMKLHQFYRLEPLPDGVKKIREFIKEAWDLENAEMYDYLNLLKNEPATTPQE